MPLEWSLDDRNCLPVASCQGWDSAPGGRQGVWQRREGGARTLPPRCLLEQPHLKLRISGQNCRLMPSSQKLGSAAGTTSTPRLPALASASLRARPPRSSFLPAFPFFLSPHPPPNRLRQQDGTNLWLNSPKITRDLSKAVCVKLTGVCTLLSNALGSEAGPATPLPASSLSQYQPSSTLLGLALKLPGRPQRK